MSRHRWVQSRKYSRRQDPGIHYIYCHAFDCIIRPAQQEGQVRMKSRYINHVMHRGLPLRLRNRRKAMLAASTLSANAPAAPHSTMHQSGIVAQASVVCNDLRKKRDRRCSRMGDLHIMTYEAAMNTAPHKNRLLFQNSIYQGWKNLLVPDTSTVKDEHYKMKLWTKLTKGEDD